MVYRTQQKMSPMIFPNTVFKFYAKNFWRYCGIVVLLYSALAIIDTFGIHVLPAFYLKKTVQVLESAPRADVMRSVIYVAVLYFAMRGFQWLCSISRWFVFDKFIKYPSYNKISSDLYQYVFNQSAEFYTASMPGKISSQIHRISESFFESAEMIFGSLTGALAAFVITAMGLGAIGWQYVVIITFAVAFRIIWGLCTVRKTLRMSGKRSDTLNTLQGRLLDALSNFMVVKMFARAKYEQEVVTTTRKQYEKDANEAHFWSRVFWAPGNLMMDTICFSLFIILSGYMYSIGQSTIADISFALAVYAGISSVAFSVVMNIKNFISSWGNATGSYNALVKPISVQDDENAPDLTVKSANIKIENLRFKYNKRFVIDNLSLDIKPGEKIGLVGLSGAGKTTLVNLIMRLYDPTSGQILIDNQDIKHVTQDSLRKNIAFIPQDATMFNRTIGENIAYGKNDASNKEILFAAKQASAHQFIKNTPDGYTTLVGDRGIKLSGGQRQRIAIARAFLKDSPILIMDEATAALDSETESVIQDSFEKLSQGRTTIVIAHRLSTLRNMDRIVVMSHGKIAESGTHNQLLRRGGLYAKLWKMQSGGFISE